MINNEKELHIEINKKFKLKIELGLEYDFHIVDSTEVCKDICDDIVYPCRIITDKLIPFDSLYKTYKFHSNGGFRGWLSLVFNTAMPKIHDTNELLKYVKETFYDSE